MFYGTLFTLPSTALSDIGANSTPVFSDLWPVVALIGGIFLAIGIAIILIKTLSSNHK